MKKGNALMIGLLIVFLILIGVGVYFYFNKSLVREEVSVVKSPSDQVSMTPVPTTTMEEDLREIEISTDDGDLKEINQDLLNL